MKQQSLINDRVPLLVCWCALPLTISMKEWGGRFTDMGGFVHVHHGEAELPVAGAGRRMGQVEGGAELRVLAVEHALRLPDEAPVAGARAAGAGRVVWALGHDAHGVALAEEVRAGQVCRRGWVGVGMGAKWETKGDGTGVRNMVCVVVRWDVQRV
jgi:hypothetical protein